MRPYLVTCALLGILVPGYPAMAQDDSATELPNAVVLGFSGPGNARVRVTVVRAVKDSLEMSAREDVETRAAELDADLSTPEGRAIVADDLRIDLFIVGEVAGRGRGTRVRLQIFDASGEEVAERIVSAPPNAAGRRALGTEAQEAVAEVADDALRLRAAREAEIAAAAVPDEAYDDEAYDDDGPRVRSPRGPREVPYVRLLAGVGGRTRNLRVDLASGDERRYESGVFLEVPVRLDVLPLAAHGGAAAGLFVRAEFAIAAALASAEQGTGEEFETSAYRMGMHVGYEHSMPRGGFGVLAGFAYESFRLDENPVLPSSRIPLFRSGLFGRYDLVGSKLQLQLDAGFRYLFGLGELGDAFGQDDGGLGFDALLSLGGRVSAFLYALRLGVEQSFLRFDGAAEDAPATGGRDLGFTLGAQIGFEI